MWLRIILLLFAQGILIQAVTLVAKVSVGGVMGTVTFTQDNAGDVAVNVNLMGPNVAQASTWQLHTFRLNYDVSDRCELTRLGPRFLGSVSGSATNGDQTVSGLELSGVDSIEGRPIAFLDASSNVIACATVESADEYITVRASFREYILGHIVFRQQKASDDYLTRVTLDLCWDGRETSARDLEWRIVTQSTCRTVGVAYNPGSVAGGCSSSAHASCAVGDLQGKLGSINVGLIPGSSRKTVVDLNLPLSGARSVLGKTIQLFVSGQSTPLACATVSAYTTRSGVATFDNDGVTGTITLTQPSPLDPTTTRVNLMNLRSQGSEYHVYNNPVPQRRAKDQDLCGEDNVGARFNPYGVVYDASTPAAGTSTEDMYQAGDLGKKYGLLNGSNTKEETYTDFNLPLFGMNSVLGRSIVIHEATNDNRWVCTSIMDTAAFTSLLATFVFPVVGQVLLRQPTGDPMAETTIYYRLDYGDGVSNPSSGHSWAVHANPASTDMLEDDVIKRCVTAGDDINPLNVNDTNYNAQCQPSAALRCKMGDLTSKHGAVSVRSGAGPQVGFFTDVNLPLQGDHSVKGKSLVLKVSGNDAQNLACATLRRVRPLVAQANTWGGEGSEDYGSMTFSQVVGVVQAPTTIDISLKSVDASSSYSIKEQRCNSLGGFYNPFEGSSSSGATKDAIPVGDLTAKFGPLTAVGGSVTKVDPSLDVWGPRSVLGRAFSLTSSSGSSVGCADITRKEQSGVAGAKLLKAEVEFTGIVTGKIMMTQYVVDKEDAMTPTTVVMDLRMAEGTQTLRHNWHTHIKPVGDDLEADTGRCASTLGHYNPFKSNVKSDQYKVECRLSNPLRCELGDQSNKLGTYDMGSGPMVVNDVYLPLYGPYGVVGRSIVVHTENRGAPRLTCADIYPADLTDSSFMSVKPGVFNKAEMVQTIASAINIETYDVTVRVISNQTDCFNTRIYFLGMEASSHWEKFNTLIGSGDDATASALGRYKPDDCGTARAGMLLASLYVVLASLVTGRLLM